MTLSGPRPRWLTFDCYGTLIQWDEGLMATVEEMLAGRERKVDPHAFISVYDRHEHDLERQPQHRSFRDVTATALGLAMKEFGLETDDGDASLLTSSIGRMPPFPEVVETLRRLREAGFRLAIISNTDDEIIARNVAQLGGYIDRVITAQQAKAYKPSPRIFEHAWSALDIEKDRFVHVCASPHLDLAAARDMQFRAIWVDRGTGRRPLAGYQPAAVVPDLAGVPDLFASAGWM